MEEEKSTLFNECHNRCKDVMVLINGLDFFIVYKASSLDENDMTATNILPALTVDCKEE